MSAFLKRRRSAVLALLIAVFVVAALAIAGDILFVVMSPSRNAQMRTRAVAEMGELVTALERHRKANGEYPASLLDLSLQFPGGLPVDPFTHLQYTYISDGTTFELRCVGADGVAGGTGENEDVVVTGPSPSK